MKSLILAVSCLYLCAAKHIVFFEPFGSQSHKNAFMPMALELLRTGHDVSFVTFRSDKRFLAAGGKEVVLEELEFSAIHDRLGGRMDFFKQRLKGGLSQKVNQLSVMNEVFDYAAKIAFESEELRNFIKNEKADLVMLSKFFADGYLPLVKLWDCPYILMSPGGIFPGTISRFGESEEYSNYPSIFTPFAGKMSFFQRVINVIAGEFFAYMLVENWPKIGKKYADRHGIVLPEGGMEEMMKNASMLFLYNHYSINNIRTFTPAIAEVGGMHCTPSKPVPQDLEEFVSGAGDDGFIIFGLGSAIQVSDMPLEFQKMFLNAFARLKQRVIWKWETTGFDKIPENVKLVKWLPQQDLLGHPKIKAFLSHGGLLSIQEAVYHSVPLVGLPLGSDQDLNVAKAVRDGYALSLDWNNISEDIIYNTIQEIVTNNRFQERADYYSTLMRDQKETPLERAIFWIEYVIRHRGAPHLHSPAKDLNRLQRNLVDVIAFLAFIALLVVAISAYVTKKIVCYLVSKVFPCGKKTNAASAKKKKN